MEELKLKIIANLKGMDKRKVQIFSPPEFVTIFINAGKIYKDANYSKARRNKGNYCYLQKKHNFETHFEILHRYNESVAFAPNESEELALAYANRSALLRHIRKYEESICEADKALRITNSSLLRVKVLCRKADCYTALDSSENRNCLEKARFFFTKFEDSEEKKKMMSDLIEKTQEIVDANKLDKPKENKKRIEAIKIVAEAERNNIWESVNMEYSTRHGRHLVAARDFEPGEIIFVEKPYLNRLNETMLYFDCYRCLEYLWTVVPCDHCAWRLYCSEKCKNEAWSEHHETECPVLVKMMDECCVNMNSYIQLSLGIFFKALKEAGSINELQSELKKIDQCADESRKGFSPDGTFEGYKTIYVQNLRKVGKEDYEEYSTSSTIALMGLAMYSEIFGRSYESTEVRELLKNETAMFVGALLFKFHLIIHSKTTTIRLCNPLEPVNYRDPELSVAIKSLGFLNVSGCAPNAQNCITYNNRHFSYALQRIKKGTPLVTSICSIYQNIPKAKRQALYKNFYGRRCECQACTENWHKAIVGDAKKEGCGIPDSQVLTELTEEIDTIKRDLKVKACRLNHPDIRLLSTAKNVVAKSWEYFPMPSSITRNATLMMLDVFDGFFRSLNLDPEKSSLCMN